MCGRYATGNISWEEYYGILNLIPSQHRWNVEPNYDVRPTDTAPVVVSGAAGREMRPMRWGFWAPWMEGRGLSTFNARADRLDQSSLWKSAFAERRALVPAVAFYEWSGEKGAKRRFAIRAAGDPFFCMAGLWMTAEGEAGVVDSFTIVTTQPSPAFSAYHHREGLMLRKADWERWLTGSIEEARALLHPLGDEEVIITEVDARATGPALLQPRRDLFG